VGRRRARCCWSDRGEDLAEERCCWIACEGLASAGMASAEATFGEGTVGGDQGRLGACSVSSCQAIEDVAEDRRDPCVGEWEGHACLVVEDRCEAGRYEA
jgi:hypothetical protein